MVIILEANISVLHSMNAYDVMDFLPRFDMPCSPLAEHKAGNYIMLD